VGGSTTYEGDHNALTWPALLQRHLRKWTGRPIEVVNAGIVALDSFGEAQHTEDYLALDPDLIIHHNFVNDMEHVMATRQADSASSGLPRSLFLRLAGVSVLVRRLFDRTIVWNESQIDRALDLTFRHYDILRNAACHKGANLAFCTFARPNPDISAEERAMIEQRLHAQFWGRGLTLTQYCWIVDRYNDRLRRYCAEHHLPILDIAPRLSGGVERYTDYCHMRLWSIHDKARLVADSILPILREARLQPDHTADTPGP